MTGFGPAKKSWVGRWMGGWMVVAAILRVAYSNQQIILNLTLMFTNLLKQQFKPKNELNTQFQ